MKNSLLIAALTMLAVPAMASKARLSALDNAAHLEDIQQIFDNPAKLANHGDWLTFELGANPGSNQPTAPATPIPLGPYNDYTANAEGGFARTKGDAKYGFYLGHHSAWVSEARQPNGFVAGQTYLNDENPVNLFYSAKAGDMNWGVGLDYSKSDLKSTKKSQSATGINAGVSTNVWDLGINVGLANTYKDEGAPNIDFKGKTAIGINGKYNVDTMTYYAWYSMNGGKDDNNTYDATTNHYLVGAENSHKSDGADFFYGVKYESYQFKNDAGTAAKYEASQLPVYAGIEADAASWLVLRASVTQNFVLGSVKNEFGGSTESDTVANNTVVAAGAGLKFNKLQLDGTIKQATGTGALSGNDLLANTSLTYMF